MKIIDHHSDSVRGALFGLAAATLFGLSTPLSKMLLKDIHPVLLSGLLYLGAAVGLWLHWAFTPPTHEAKLNRNDISVLGCMIFLGGVIAPLCMLFGLDRVTALTGSLMLNLEAPFTVIVASVLFREHLGWRASLATCLILAGSVVLKYKQGALNTNTLGFILLAAACLAWALDNNLTQKLSVKDPFAIVRAKTLIAGIFNTLLGLFISNFEIPSFQFIAWALIIGSFSYGLSVVLDTFALRLVGAVREAAYFSMAPFVGALFSIMLLHEPLQWRDIIAMGVMGAGAFLLLRENHHHLHTHDALYHDHLHAHDMHHQHEHQKNDPPGEPHSHPHRHEQITHAHAHVPDVHHRHKH